jgi:hypothetical protein
MNLIRTDLGDLPRRQFLHASLSTLGLATGPTARADGQSGPPGDRARA